MAKTTVDESVDIIPSADGNSFTVVDTGIPPARYASDATPMTKNDVIGVSIVASVVAAVIGGVGWFAYKDEQKRNAEIAERKAEQKRKREERQAWFDKQRKDGKTVIETWDGEYMAIPNDAYAAAEVRPKGM